MKYRIIIISLMIGILYCLISIVTVLNSCSPTGKGGDYCDRLLRDKKQIIEFYEEGEQKRELLKIIDSLINKTCNYETEN